MDMQAYDVKNKNIIVFGLGVTGISSVKALSALGANVYIYDANKNEKYHKTIEELSDSKVSAINDLLDIDWKNIDLVLKSPGIRLDQELIISALENNIEVISDIELAYRIWPNISMIGITGTNGKTTTTSLVSHILSCSGTKSKVVGNIGVGILDEVLTNGLDTTFVLEVSSFQLASSPNLKTKYAAILNISPDHIDWHGSFEEYKKCKIRLTSNQTKDDVIVLNNDDSYFSEICENTVAKIRRISSINAVNEGSYCLEDNIYRDGQIISIKRSDLKLVGDHNTQNLLFAIELAMAFGRSEDDISNGVKTFKPIEHRIEPVKVVNGAMYYNDSKGTNVDSTVKAIGGFKEPIILIAGGYDKKATYDDLFDGVKNLKEVILFGQRKFDIEATAKKYGIQTLIVDDLEQAVKRAYDIALDKDVVLFSPACASWGMYNNFEERGRHFKELVNKL